MSETRSLAAQYYKLTQQTLRVSTELACYDAARLLALKPLDPPQPGVDFISQHALHPSLPAHISIQIKSRVLFSTSKNSPRLGQLNMEGTWQSILLVLYDADYQPREIYICQRDTLQAELAATATARQKRGALSVAKFKAIGHKLWPTP